MLTPLAPLSLSTSRTMATVERSTTRITTSLSVRRFRVMLTRLRLPPLRRSRQPFSLVFRLRTRIANSLFLLLVSLRLPPVSVFAGLFRVPRWVPSRYTRLPQSRKRLSSLARRPRLSLVLASRFMLRRLYTTLTEITISTEEEFDSLTETSLPMVVLVTAPAWCIPCQRFEPHWTRAQDSLSDVTFVKIDAGESPEATGEHWASKRFGVMGVPFVFVINEDYDVVTIKARAVVPFISEVS